jgi:hypothetical protein
VGRKKTSIYLDDDLDQALARRAAEEGVTKAEFIRRGLEGLVARKRRPRPHVALFTGPADLARHHDAYLAEPERP